MSRALVLLLCAAIFFTGPALAETSPHSVEPVTQENLLDSERYWPYHVKLVETWTPPGMKPLEAPKPGVLVRVEASGLARIDFAAGGLHEVPVEKTNLLEQANGIREGRKRKAGANLVVAVGPRLIDGGASTPAPTDVVTLNEAPAFLLVFADPMAADFAALADSLRTLEGKLGLRTILFPHGGYVDADVLRALQSVNWPVAFVMDRFSELYARKISSTGTRPSLLLGSREGRVLFEEPWNAEAARRLAAVVRQLGQPSMARVHPNPTPSHSSISR